MIGISKLMAYGVNHTFVRTNGEERVKDIAHGVIRQSSTVRVPRDSNHRKVTFALVGHI